MCLPSGSVEKGLSKEITASASSSLWEEATLPVCALKPDDSFSPHMFLVPFELLPQCWSWDEVSPSKFLCSLVFTARSYGLIFSALEPWASRPGVGWDPGSSGGLMLPEYPAWFLSTTCGCGTSLFCVSVTCSLYLCQTAMSNQARCGFFYITLVLGLPSS